jgi:hypothetical protein
MAEEDSPLQALLDQYKDTPPLGAARLREPSCTSDGGAPADAPISVTLRQPSFSLLTDEIRLTGGAPLHPTRETDPVIVWDSSSSDAEIPSVVALTVRQGSRQSLTGGDVSARLDLCERRHELAIVTEEGDNDIGPLPEEPSNPQTRMIRRLFDGNWTRWREMGYEPPSWQSFERAASLDDVHVKSPATAGHPRSLTDTDETAGLFEVIPEDASSPAPVAEPAEAPWNSRLATLNPAITDPVRQLLITGDLDPDSDRDRARANLRRVLDECANRLWYGEADYVNSLMALLARRPESPRRVPTASNDLDRLSTAKERLRRSHRAAVAEAREQMAAALEDLNGKYREAADRLDAKWQSPATLQRYAKPSKELLELRLVAQRLIKQGRREEAARVARRIGDIERAETERVNAAIDERYRSEDKRLKEDFASRKEILLQKYAGLIEEKQQRFREAAAAVERKIELLTTEAVRESSPPGSRARGERPKRKTAADFGTAGRFYVQPPAPINRQTDLAEIDHIAMTMLQRGSRRSPGLDSIFRETLHLSTT